eukprot:m.100165 g.100165  ORF g.100165 m.100165 type:complete len:354 (-) comp15116_c0_seq4:1100-2161(-)
MTDSSDSALSLPPDPAHPVLRPCRSLASQAAKRLLLAEGPAATSCGKHACPTCLNANRLKLCLACPTVNYIQAKLCRNKSCRAVFASKHKRSTITSREEYNTKVRLARAAIAKAHALVRDLQHVAPEVELTSFFHAPTPPFIADVAQPDKRPDPKRARVVDNASPHDDEERSKGWLYPMVEVYLSGGCTALPTQLRHREDGLLTCQPSLVSAQSGQLPQSLDSDTQPSWSRLLPPCVLAFQQRFLPTSTLRTRALVQAGNTATQCQHCHHNPASYSQHSRSSASAPLAAPPSLRPAKAFASCAYPNMAAAPVPCEPWTSPYICSEPFDLDEALLSEPLPSLAQVCREVRRDGP